MIRRRRPRKGLEELMRTSQGKRKPKPKPKAKPGAPVVGDSSFLKESDGEGVAASVKVKNVKNRKVSSDDDIGEIIFNEAVYSTRNVWKPAIKKPLRPDIKKYDMWEVTAHREQSRFDAKVAEARAILMTPNTSVKEVHIPAGPNGDIAIAMRLDEEDGLVFGRQLIHHVCGKHGIKGEAQTLSVPAKGGHDLISKNRAKKLGLKIEESDNPMSLFPANGVTSTNDVAKINFGEFGTTHSPYVLDESPSALSAGEKCMEEGYSFVWPANGAPYMISSENKKILLEVPYVVKDSDFCSPTIDEQVEHVSKLIIGHIDAGDQPDVFGHEVDARGFNSDSDNHPSETPVKVKRRRKKKKRRRRRSIKHRLAKTKKLFARIPKKNLTKQRTEMTLMISKLMLSMALAEWSEGEPSRPKPERFSIFSHIDTGIHIVNRVFGPK